MSKKNSAPKLNGRHSVVIRMGASNYDVTVDGGTLDLSKRDGESTEEHKGRIQRTSNDLVGMIFS